MPVLKRISEKISVALLAPLALLLIGLSAGSYWYVSSILKQEIERQQAAMMNLVAGQLDNTLSQSMNLLRIVGESISPAEIQDAARQQRYLDNETDSRFFFSGGFLLLDRNGKIIVESPSYNRKGEDRSFRDYVKIPLKTGKPAISAPYLALVTPRIPSITFSVPIKEKSGAVVGVLAGRHDLTKDIDLNNLSQVSIGRSGYLYLMDANRTLIMHKDHSRILEVLPPGKNPGLDRAIAGFEGTVENVNSKGVAGLTTFKRLKNAPWIVASHIPLDEAYLPIRRAQSFFAMTFVMILGFSWFMVVFASRRVTAPIDRFIAHVRGIAEDGDRKRTIDLETGDEIETLAEAFNSMVLELDRRQESLLVSQDVYRTLAEFTSEIAILKDEKMNVRYISPNCEAIIGYRDEEFIADPELIERIVCDDDKSIWKSHRDKLEEDGCCSGIDLRLVAKSGEVRWFSHSCHTLYDDNGRVTGTRGGFRDISQRMLMEEKLDAQRRFVEKIMESTSTPLFVIGSDHRVIIWNRALEILTGCDRNRMIGTDGQWEPFYQTKRPTLADLILDSRLDLLEESYDIFTLGSDIPGMVRSEGWYDNINAMRRYLLFEASPVIGEDGRIVAVVETFHDLTSRKHTEERLTLFSQAVDQSASSIVITDPDGTIEYVNEKFCRVSGYSRDETIGQDLGILTSGGQGDELYAELWKAIKSGNPWHGELSSRRKDGAPYWELVTVAPIIGSSGEITNFLAVKDDISARKESERKLHKHQAELEVKHEELSRLYKMVEQGKLEWETTMDCIGDILIIADNFGAIRRCNRSFTEFTGRGYDDLMGKTWWDFIVCDDVERGELHGDTGELYHKPSGRWFYLNSYPYGDLGSGNVIITLHDMTDIKQVSDELKSAYEELKTTHLQLLQQEKMASIGQLAAGVAHEINNPMGFIGSNLVTMGKYVGRLNDFIAVQSEVIDSCAAPDSRGRVAEERRRLKVDYVIEDIPKLLQESLDGAERVKTIVQNLKSFSRVDESEQKETNINDCLESTISIAWNELKYKVTLEKEYGELPPVVCHSQQVNQVFLNLLVNAAHAIDKQGQVRIRTWHEAGAVHVSISDTGCGIPAENLTRIFEPFFTTKEVGKGTGLGLSISYDIIKKHGGEITVTSEVGAGTTFTVHLPVAGG